MARPSERSISACAPARGERAARGEPRLRAQVRGDAARRRPAARPSSTRQPGGRRAERPGHVDAVPGARAVAADEVLLAVGPADDRDGDHERRARGRGRRRRSSCRCAAASASIAAASATHVGRADVRRDAERDVRLARRRRPSRRGPTARRRARDGPASAAVARGGSSRKWTPSTIASTLVTANGRARTTAASSPTQRTTRSERGCISRSNAAISSSSPHVAGGIAAPAVYRWR